jgi:ABC-type branched-subunit amino acid transport system permease subunit
LLKSFGLSLGETLGWVFLAAIAQALLFGIVFSRVRRITFALVTLGMASVSYIVSMSRELGEDTGFDLSALQALRRLTYRARMHCDS